MPRYYAYRPTIRHSRQPLCFSGMDHTAPWILTRCTPLRVSFPEMARSPSDKQLRPARGTYTVEAVRRACDVLRAFRFDGELLRLRDVVARTGLHKATAYRTLLSLVEGGLAQRVGNEEYRTRVRAISDNRVRLGYGVMASDSVFSRDVTDGLRRAASESGFELVEYDNRYNAKVAIRNAHQFVRDKVALVFEV